MLYEKKLNSLPELLNELNNLDFDAGIRAIGKYNSKRCFVFVTRSANGFTSLLYNIKSSGKESLPDKRLLAKEFPDFEQTKEFLSRIIAKPIKAVAY
jgi:hypothetical protein